MLAAGIGIGSVFAARQLTRAFKEKPQAEQAFQDAARRIRAMVGSKADHGSQEARAEARAAVKQFEALVQDLPLSLNDIHDYIEAARQPGMPISAPLAEMVLKRIAPDMLLAREPHLSFARGVLEDAFAAAVNESPVFTGTLTLELVRGLIADLGETRADLTKRFNDLRHELERQTDRVLAAMDQLGDRLESKIEGGTAAILAAIAKLQPDAQAAQAAVAEVEKVLIANTPQDAPAQAALAAGDVEGAYDALMDEVQTDRRKAAERARAAGALQYGRSVRKALDAYEEAEVLAPGDFWTLIFLVRLYERAGLIANASAAARKALAAAMTERDRSAALSDFSDIALRAGDVGAARTAYEESLEIARRLAAADPADARAQRDLSVSLDNVGDAALRAGDAGAARAAYGESLDIRRRLAAADEADAQAQRDLSVSLIKVGDAALRAGDAGAARTAYGESLDIRRRLATADEADAQAQRDLSVSLYRLAGAGGGGWPATLAHLEHCAAKGFLEPGDAAALEEARRRVAGGAD